MTNAVRPWSVAIFTSRESPDVLLRCVQAIHKAAKVPTTVDVLINGNRSTATQALPRLSRLEPATGGRLRLWFLPVGDKAATFNRYVHEIWPRSALAYFIDGYVLIRPPALETIAAALATRPGALAAAGVPNEERGNQALRQEMLRDGGLHGNLYALPDETLQRLRGMGFKLPLGLYRTDSTLGAALSFGLDPARHDWQMKERIALVQDATWDVDRRPWWYWSELRGRWRRRARQAQGVLENLAVRHHLAQQRRSPAELPDTAAELVAAWAAVRPEEFNAAVRRRAMRAARAALQQPRDWSAQAAPAELLFDSDDACD